jgi:hypothetical protein
MRDGHCVAAATTTLLLCAAGENVFGCRAVEIFFVPNGICPETVVWLNVVVLSTGIVANVCVSSVVRFRSRVLSPTLNVERRYKLWATPHRTIEETFCWQQLGLGSVVLYVFSVHWFEVYVLSSVNEAQLHNFLSRSRSFILSRPFCIWVRSSICQRTRIESQCWNYPTALH